MGIRVWTDEEIAKHDELASAGATTQEIATKIGRSHGSVRNMRHRYGKKQMLDGFKNRKPSSRPKISADDVCPICKRAPTRGRVCWPCSVVMAHLKALKGGDAVE